MIVGPQDVRAADQAANAIVSEQCRIEKRIATIALAAMGRSPSDLREHGIALVIDGLVLLAKPFADGGEFFTEVIEPADVLTLG